MKITSCLIAMVWTAGCGTQFPVPATTPSTVLEASGTAASEGVPTRPCFGGADAEGNVLVTAVGPIVSLVLQDASSRRILALESLGTVSTTGLYVDTLQARGDYLALSFRPSGGSQTRAVLLDGARARRWEATDPFLKLHLGDDGHLAANFGTQMELFSPSGGTTTLQGVVALSEPTADGTVAVQSTVAAGGFGWIYKNAGPMHPLAYPILNNTYPRWTAFGFVYLSRKDGQVVLVAEQAGKVPQVVDLSAFSQGVWLELKHVSVNGRVVVGPHFVTPGNLTTMVEVDLSSGVARNLRQDFPRGMHFFNRNQKYLGVEFAQDGSVMVGLRGEFWGGLFRSEDFGRKWNLVGAKMSGVTGVDVTESAGTYLVKGSTSTYGLYSFASVNEEWPPVRDGESTFLVGDGALQIVRPRDGTSMVIPDSTSEYWNTSVSRDGLCAVRWTQVDRPLEFQLVDLKTGVSTAVAVETAAHPAGTYFGVNVDWYR